MSRALPTGGLSAAQMNVRPGRKVPKAEQLDVRGMKAAADAALKRFGHQGGWRTGMRHLFDRAKDDFSESRGIGR